jgi:hypothetical protein
VGNASAEGFGPDSTQTWTQPHCTELGSYRQEALGPDGPDGLAALEVATRAAMTKLGGSLLEQLLGVDSGHRGQRIDCGAGHDAEFVSDGEETFDTVLGTIRLNRTYYYCAACHAGPVPKDDQLGVTGVSLSLALRAMVARVGAGRTFAKAAALLGELAGVTLTTKRLERAAEADGAALAALAECEAAAVATGEVIPLAATKPVEKLYIVLDGTGVPMVAAPPLDA